MEKNQILNTKEHYNVSKKEGMSECSWQPRKDTQGFVPGPTGEGVSALALSTMSKAFPLTRLVTLGPEDRGTLPHVSQGSNACGSIISLFIRGVLVCLVDRTAQLIRNGNVSEGGLSRADSLRVAAVYFLCLGSKVVEKLHQVILCTPGPASNEATLDLPHRGQSLARVFFMFSFYEHYLLALYMGPEMSWWGHTSFSEFPGWILYHECLAKMWHPREGGRGCFVFDFTWTPNSHTHDAHRCCRIQCMSWLRFWISSHIWSHTSNSNYFLL